MSRAAALLATASNPLRVCDSADFDGANDWMSRGGALTGQADGKSGIFSAWVRLDGGDGTTMFMFADTAVPVVGLQRLNTNKIQVFGANAASTFILLLPTAASYTASATWLHILASWDLAAAAAHLYINDVSDKGSTTLTNDTIHYTNANWGIGAFNGVNKFNGCIAEKYFAPNQFLDFSLVSNRRKFISASGKPVHLGTTGSLPTGTAPICYHHLDDGEAVANFATNRGTGGNFTITGTLDTGTTSPSD